MLSIALFFQNCGKDYKGTRQSSNSATQTEQDNRVAPDFLPNRNISLDHKDSHGDSAWSVGGEDKFYYETDYRARFKSTLVTIFGRNSEAILIVQSDECEGERQLNSAEASQLSNLFQEYIPNTAQKVPDPESSNVSGCSFPRLIVDSAQTIDGIPAVDFEIFFTTVQCTPDNELYVVNIGGDTGLDPIQAKADVEAWFNAQIDLICGPQ